MTPRPIIKIALALSAFSALSLLSPPSPLSSPLKPSNGATP